ncbi:MAG: hypothetical protein II668_04905, partial [Oscillospiraceae bacterium]|nr:hypothetical protein [Oscillospiraceae bacterium]
ALNAMRREALTKLDELRGRAAPHAFAGKPLSLPALGPHGPVSFRIAADEAETLLSLSGEKDAGSFLLPAAKVTREVANRFGGRLIARVPAKSLSEKNLDTEIYRSCAIIWSHSMTEPVVVDKVTCQVDLLPTVSNLLGLSYDSRMLAGKDAMCEDEGMVIFHSKSWRTDSGFYNALTQTFTPAPGVTMTEDEQAEYVSYMKKYAANKLNMTAKIIENDFYNVMKKYIK